MKQYKLRSWNSRHLVLQPQNIIFENILYFFAYCYIYLRSTWTLTKLKFSFPKVFLRVSFSFRIQLNILADKRKVIESVYFLHKPCLNFIYHDCCVLAVIFGFRGDGSLIFKGRLEVIFRTLKENQVPMLYQHNHVSPVGMPKKIHSQEIKSIKSVFSINMFIFPQ